MKLLVSRGADIHAKDYVRYYFFIFLFYSKTVYFSLIYYFYSRVCFYFIFLFHKECKLPICAPLSAISSSLTNVTGKCKFGWDVMINWENCMKQSFINEKNSNTDVLSKKKWYFILPLFTTLHDITTIHMITSPIIEQHQCHFILYLILSKIRGGVSVWYFFF
mgnify:CR=1 FL=1